MRPARRAGPSADLGRRRRDTSVIKEILYRAADRAQIVTTLIANMPLRIPPSAFIKTIRVPKGFDVADHYIVQHLEPGDLVITADIPLAAEVIKRAAHAIDPRGDLYSEDNVDERLAMRNLMQQLARRATTSAVRDPSGRATASASPISSTAS